MVTKLSLVECMAAVEDPRVDRTKAHDLQDILVLAVQVVLAVLSGADGWEDIVLFADGGGDYVLARNRGQSQGIGLLGLIEHSQPNCWRFGGRPFDSMLGMCWQVDVVTRT